MKTGLVLEGGGLRGIFSAGVLDVLMEEGIEFDGGIGVSAGAAFGCNVKSRQPRRAIRYNLKYAKDPRYSSMRSLLSTGDLFNAQFCYHEIPEKLDPFDWDAFRENPMEFYLVCTDVETGKPVYHLCDKDDEWEMLEWFRASGSMPVVSRVVEIGGYKLLDGGITDSIPLRYMEEQGYERNLVILTRPAGYVKKPAPMMRMISRALREYPAAVEAIANRHNAYNESLAYIRQREAGKYALVIRPEEDLDIGRVEHDRYKIRETYKAGRKAGRRHLKEIRRFLDNAKNENPDRLPGVRASIIGTAPDEEKAAVQPAVAEPAAEVAPEVNPAAVAEPAAAEAAAEVEPTVAVEPAGAEAVAEVEAVTAEVNPAAAVKPAVVEVPETVEQVEEAGLEEAPACVAEPAAAEAAAEAEPAEAEAGTEVEPAVAAEPEAAEAVEEVEPAVAAEPEAAVQMEEHSGASLPRIPAPFRSRRQRKGWKPGNMTALKQRAEKE